MEIRDRKSPHYVCSIDPKSLVDLEILEVIKRSVKAANAYAKWEETSWGMIKNCKRITVKGREPKFLRNGRKYTYSGDIAATGNKYEICRRLDIYIHDDRRYMSNV